MARIQGMPFLHSDIGGKTAKGLGKTTKGAGKGKTAVRHKKILRDNINGITRNDLRRLARRGGIKRISTGVYPEMRLALRKRLELIIKDVCAIVECCRRKTVATSDVVMALKRQNNPIYGFGEGGESSLRKGAKAIDG